MSACYVPPHRFRRKNHTQSTVSTRDHHLANADNFTSPRAPLDKLDGELSIALCG
jgi:hypothetical protein